MNKYSFLNHLPIWTIIAPLISSFVVLGTLLGINHFSYTFFLAIGLVGGILAAVHHAEVIAHRIGEPYGTLVLALAVTMIEVSLIISLMISGGAENNALARDTVFAAVMIILNGIVGLCLLVGGIKHHEQTFGLDGASGSLTILVAIVVLTLILPNFTLTASGPYYSSSQLVFVSIISLILYGTFVLFQTVRHRDYFLPEAVEIDQDSHAQPPSFKTALLSLFLLLISLVAVVLSAKILSPIIENGVQSLGAPSSLVGIIIATVILLPEGLSALSAAKKNRLQTSLNLALGSAIATIGLTIPAVAMVSLYLGLTLTLGIDIKSTLLLFLSLFVTVISLGTGKTTVLQGVVYLVLFAIYLFTTIVP